MIPSSPFFVLTGRPSHDYVRLKWWSYATTPWCSVRLERRAQAPSSPGRRPHPETAYVKTLLVQTVHALQAIVPGFGDTVAFDVKQQYIWVQRSQELF